MSGNGGVSLQATSCPLRKSWDWGFRYRLIIREIVAMILVERKSRPHDGGYAFAQTGRNSRTMTTSSSSCQNLEMGYRNGCCGANIHFETPSPNPGTQCAARCQCDMSGAILFITTIMVSKIVSNYRKLRYYLTFSWVKRWNNIQQSLLPAVLAAVTLSIC